MRAAVDFIVAAVVLRDDDGRVLVVRKRGTSRYMLPGGKIEVGESPAEAAIRELREEVGAELDPARLVELGVWTAPAANEPGHLVRGHVFQHPWVPGLAARAEIDDVLWLHPADVSARADMAPLLVTCVLPALVPLVETSRLVLRRFSEADIDGLVRLDADPEVMHFITGGRATSRSEIADVVLPHWLNLYDRGSTCGFWAADDRSSGEFIGWFHLRPGEGHGPDEPELGYRLRRSSWGQGLATEGCAALLDVAFTRSDAVRVLAETMAVHVASRRVMEKVGMTLVREFTANWPDRIPGDEFGDVEYAIDRATWSRMRSINSSSGPGSG